MKKTLVTLAVAIISYCSYAQTNTFPPSGNAGIGTTTPAPWIAPYKVLDLYGYGFLFGSSNGTGYNGTGYGQTAWGNNSYYDGTSHAIGTGAASSLLQGTGYLIFQNAPAVNAGGTQTFTERFRIDNNGNVGIGTSSPAEILTLRDPGIAYDSSSGIVKLRFDSGYGAGGIGFEKETFNTGGLRFYTQYGYESTLEKMRITANGNVLIGQTNQVNSNYKLDVAGAIRSNEIVVNTTGADFVFEPVYKLPSISSVEKYIKLNHHLPEIPSANQMAKEGLNLGDMNIKLLKKVEELTLYLIQQKEESDQQNKAQQRQINELKSQMAKLIK